MLVEERAGQGGGGRHPTPACDPATRVNPMLSAITYACWSHQGWLDGTTRVLQCAAATAWTPLGGTPIVEVVGSTDQTHGGRHDDPFHLTHLVGIAFESSGESNPRGCWTTSSPSAGCCDGGGASRPRPRASGSGPPSWTDGPRWPTPSRATPGSVPSPSRSRQP